MSLAPDRATREQLRLACDAVNAELRRRRGLLKWAGLAGLVLVALAAWRAPQLVPHAAIAAAAFVLGVGRHIRQSVGREYKHWLATTIIPLLRPGLTFAPSGSIGIDDFNALHLFPQQADRVAAQDELRGERNGVSYAVEELRATYTSTSGSGRSRRRTTHTIFRGAVVRLEFNKHFHGHTVVVPHYFGAGFLSRLFGGRLQPVTLEDPAFERAFLTRSTDEQEARYILTPRFMEIVLAARARLGQDLRLAFHQGTLHVLIAGTKDRFEVSLFGGVAPSQAVTDLDEVIRLAEGLIGTLELQTRIWTRV